MTNSEIDLINSGLLNATMTAFVEKKSELSDFSNFYETNEVVNEINKLNFKPNVRKALIEHLNSQYSATTCSLPSSVNLLHDKNTFTVTTGHQLNFLTGPKYSIYKIASVIALAKKLTKLFPKYNFVPVFWLASEDHDFEEVSSVNVFRDSFAWDSEQSGAVGRMSPSNQETVLNLFFEKLKLSEIQEKELRSSLDAENLSVQYTQLIHQLFADYPELIILDADSHVLKSEFKDIVKNELTTRTSFDLINESTSQLKSMSFKTQINPREINLFYLKDNLRERIVFENGKYQILNSEIVFSLEEILTEVDDFPERFSPNVALRPVYQQVILPNLAYIGGGGELTYWHQLKSSFKHYEAHFPFLCMRDSFVFLKEKQMKKWNSFGFNLSDIFSELNGLLKSYVARNSEEISFKEEHSLINELFNLLQEKAALNDPSLAQGISAEKAKQEKALLGIISRFEKSNKRKHDVAIGQITKIKESVFPKNSFQERVSSIWNELTNDDELIRKIVELSDCTENKIKIITN